MTSAYYAKYIAYELSKRCPSDSIEKLASTLADAQVDLNPHQIDAALFAFRSPLSKGALLADEVGLGKTIEAGLVLSQKWAERKRKLLIIAPANLRKQWSQELSDKFFLGTKILESASFNVEIKHGNLNPFVQPEIVICSYQFARSKDAYLKQIAWDLVIIDEAHRLRNVYKASNKIANAIKDALSEAPKILLTATPLQNSILELYGLVSIIDDRVFGDLKSFRSQYASLRSEDDFLHLRQRIKSICQRTLRRQVLEYIKYTNRIPITQEFYPSDDEQKLYDAVSNYLQRPVLYALPQGQRQLMTLILRKLLASSTFAIAGTLEALCKKLESQEEDQALMELSLPELAPDLETISELEEEWEENEDKEDKDPTTELSPEEREALREELGLLREFAKLANKILRNSKGEALLTALEQGMTELERLGAQQKAIIFTESTRTQAYLLEILERTRFAGKTVLFNGSNNDGRSREIYKAWLKKHDGTDIVSGSPTADMRAALVDCFRNEASIMIATEAAAEGINLQFCSLVVNYDLPWNPQRIEQRIGRCHRYGQKYDVVVVNFLNKKNAADVRVFQLLSEKFQLFNGVFGASDEVLGSIENGVDFEKRIAAIYQSCRTADEIDKKFNELQLELETEIDETIALTKEKLLENFDEEVQEKLRISKRESEEYLSKYENWLWQVTRFYLQDFARFEGEKNFFVLEKNPFPDEVIHPGPYQTGKGVEDVNLYRLGHPLAQRILEGCKEIPTENRALVFDYTESGKSISALRSLVGKRGTLAFEVMSVSTFEVEDHLQLVGFTDDGESLDRDLCTRLLSLPVVSVGPVSATCPHAAAALQNSAVAILGEVQSRNMAFFEAEIEKLDEWATDLKKNLEVELKELDIDIKIRKREATLASSLEQKLGLHREIKDLEKKRTEKRRMLFEAQDEVDAQKETLLKNTEQRLKQLVTTNRVFEIEWRVQ